MKKIVSVAVIAAMLMISVFASASDDIYDPATNQLTIPSITVDGTTYTDVVVTVGRIIKIGGSSKAEIDSSKDWTCSWTFDDGNDYHNIKYDLTIHPSSKTISVKLTGLTNISSFYPFEVDLVQGSKSTEVTFVSGMDGVLWAGDDGFDSGKIPSGVTKTGTLSRFPSWFDLNQPFSWLSDRNRHDC